MGVVMFTCGCVVGADNHFTPCHAHSLYMSSKEKTVDELLTFCKRNKLYFSLAWILRTVRKLKDAQEAEAPAFPDASTNESEAGQAPQAT